MPIQLKINIEPYGELGVWKVIENEQFFLKDLYIFEDEKPAIHELKARKLMEWLSSRFLLHIMSGRKERGAVLKDEFGKPFLEDSPFYISLSHSKDLTAVIASPYLVGVDIQYFVPKITRIAPKFVSKEESKLINHFDEMLYLHFICGAKESLFKAYGKGNIDFKKDLKILSIVKEHGGFSGVGLVHKPDFEMEFDLIGSTFEDYLLVYAVAKQ